MYNFEFLKQNYINTTTTLSVTNATATVSKMLDRDKDTQWTTSGYLSTTATTISFTPASTKVISRIAIINHNLKDFRIYYGDTTTNVLSLTGQTQTTVWTTNSETSHYLIVASTTISASIPLHILINAAQTTDTERKIGDLYVGQDYMRFANNPSAKNYKPKPEEKVFKHEMSDGGMVKYFLKEKFNAEIGLDFVSSTERSNFRTVWKEHLPFVFVPYPNTSSWDSDMYEVNWMNSFDFFALETESLSPGFKGKIVVEETPI